MLKQQQLIVLRVEHLGRDVVTPRNPGRSAAPSQAGTTALLRAGGWAVSRGQSTKSRPPYLEDQQGVGKV